MNFKKIEKKWQKQWEKEGTYKTKENKKGRKFYNLVMFPYPSGNLHIGHWYNFAPADVLARFKKMSGNNVLAPIGFDAFGLPAENAAIKRGIHPKDWTYKNIKTMSDQLKSMGAMYDWERKIITADPEYYKWTQWIFAKLFEEGLAYRKKASANWCPNDKTVLANEQVIDGKCDRCGTEVVQKEIEQWLFKITDYSQRLLDDLESLDWPEKIKLMQRNWIGKSEGALVNFGLKINSLKISSETLKFDSSLIELILSGEKNITYRLEEKNLKIGDVFKLINSLNKKEFALAKIVKIEKKKMGAVSENQTGHEKFKSRKAMYEVYGGYYGKKVNDNTDVWVYYFDILPENFEIFTTRVDTIFGCTYMVLAPEHKSIEKIKDYIENYKEVSSYILKAKKKMERERMIEEKEKTGVEVKGICAINPFTKEEVKVFVADYVLGNYGTGAVMAVPAHDERDFDFANKYNLKIIKTIKPEDENADNNLEKKIFTDDGVVVNSGRYNGMRSKQAREKMIEWLKGEDFGKEQINYKLRDWLISRQRYWGSPIPLVYCQHCKEKIEAGNFKKGEFSKGEILNPGWICVLEKDLPVKLPNVKDYLPTSEGKSPLAHSNSFVKTKCPKCGEKGTRETDTMDTFVCSSWYYLRYADPKNNKKFADDKKIKQWLPVDMYIGGAEHAVLHLLYARFFTKFLYDKKYLNFKEPFSALRNQGMILGPDGQKMSKSKGNVIDPDDLVSKFGADAVRTYLCFMGPYDQGGAWQPSGIIGIERFLKRIERLYEKKITKAINKKGNGDLKKIMHKTIKKVGEDISELHYNTAISSLMIMLNAMENNIGGIDNEIANNFLILLAPFAPHLTEEIWRMNLGHKNSIHSEVWPKYNPKLVIDNTYELVVQLNGKIKDRIMVDKGISQEKAKEVAMASDKIKGSLDKIKIKKIIFVPDRLINIVI